MATRSLRRRDNSVNYSDALSNEDEVGSSKPKEEVTRKTEKRKRKEDSVVQESSENDEHQQMDVEPPKVRAKTVRKPRKQADVEGKPASPTKAKAEPQAKKQKKAKVAKAETPSKPKSKPNTETPLPIRMKRVKENDVQFTPNPEEKQKKMRDREIEGLKGELEDLRKQLATERSNFKKLKEVRSTPSEHRNEQLEEALKKLTQKQEQTAMQFKDALKQLKTRNKSSGREDAAMKELKEECQTLKAENADLKQEVEEGAQASEQANSLEQRCAKLEKIRDMYQIMSGVDAQLVVEDEEGGSSSALPEKYLCSAGNDELQRSIKYMLTVNRALDEVDYQPLHISFVNEEVPDFMSDACVLGAEDVMALTLNMLQQIHCEDGV